MTRQQKVIFWSIFLFSVILIFFRLGRQDMLGDDGHYSFRAISYFDYLGSRKQTTPVQWFSYRPAWSWFSFHDHPPLYFLVQNVIFKIFGLSVVTSRFTSAFAAAGSLIVIFFLGKRLGGVRLGLVAMAALAVNSYFLWQSRIGHLESLMTFLLLLGLYYLYRALGDDTKNFWRSGLFLGLALLTKYTLLYAIPGILFYLLLKKRWVFGSRRFWLGFLTFLILGLPLVIYNVGMYQARGHFDVQFADLFGQSGADWSNLNDRVSHINLNPLGLLQTLQQGLSWPYLLLFGMAFFWFFYRNLRRRESPLDLVFFVGLSMMAFFLIIGSAARWVGVVTPFVALLIAGVLEPVWESRFRYVAASLATMICIFSIFYSLNTNHFRKPIGGKNFYTEFRVENYGYNQLDKKINNLLANARTSPVIQESMRLWWYGSIRPEAIDFASINLGTRNFPSAIVIDSNTIWFPRFWIFEKWKFYHRILIFTSEELLQVDRDSGLGVLKEIGIDKIYYIKAGKKVRETAELPFQDKGTILETFEKMGTKPPEVVRDDQSREAFYIYEIDRPTL